MRRFTLMLVALLWPAAAASMTCPEAQMHAVWLCDSLTSAPAGAEWFGGGSFPGNGFAVSGDPNSRLHGTSASNSRAATSR